MILILRQGKQHATFQQSRTINETIDMQRRGANETIANLQGYMPQNGRSHADDCLGVSSSLRGGSQSIHGFFCQEKSRNFFKKAEGRGEIVLNEHFSAKRSRGSSLKKAEGRGDLVLNEQTP